MRDNREQSRRQLAVSTTETTATAGDSEFALQESVAVDRYMLVKMS